MRSSKYLIEAGPTNWVEGLAEYYTKRNQQEEKSLAEWKQHRAEKVKVAGEESLVRVVDQIAKFSSSAMQLKNAIDAKKAKDEVKEKNKHINLLNNLHRGEGSTEAIHKYHSLVAEYEKDGQNILDNQVEHNKILLQAYPKPELIVDGILQIDSKTGQPIIDKKAFDKFAEIRNAYQKLSPAELLITREYDGIKFSQTLHGKAFDVYLAREGLLETYNNASEPDKANMMQSWQVDELAPYAFSDGIVGSNILDELNRSSGSKQGVNRAFQSTAFATEAAINFKEKGKVFSTQGGVDGEGRGNFARFVSYEIVKGSLDFEDDPPETLNGQTAMQKSKDRVVSWLSELAITENVNIPELLGSKISELPGGNTLQQAFFDKKGENYQQLMSAWNTGQKYRVAEFDAQRDGNLSAAYSAAVDGNLSESQKQLALNNYLSAGGDENNAVYKALSGMNTTAQTKEVAEAEREHINSVLSSGRPDIFDDEIERLTNTNVKSQSQLISEDYKRLRKLNLDDEKNSDGYADGLLNERNELNLAPGGKIPPRMEPARDLISQMRDQIWWEEFNIAKAAGNLNDNTIKDRVNARLTDKLTALGFYSEMNDPSKGPRGILTPNSEGEYPALVARKAALNELNAGSDKSRTVYELNTAWDNLGNKTIKNKTALLATKGAVLSNAELIALARNHWDPDTKTFTGWPKDVLIKSEILGIPPSELVRGQLEALIASNYKEDQFIVESFKLKDLQNNIPDSDLKVLQFLQDVGDTDILAKYKNLGLQNFSNNQLNRLLSLEAGFQQKLGTERELTVGEADVVDTQQRMDASKGTAASPELPANYGAQEDLQFKAAKWYREGKWDGLNKDQLIKLLKEEKLKLQTTE